MHIYFCVGIACLVTEVYIVFVGMADLVSAHNRYLYDLLNTLWMFAEGKMTYAYCYQPHDANPAAVSSFNM